MTTESKRNVWLDVDGDIKSTMTRKPVCAVRPTPRAAENETLVCQPHITTSSNNLSLPDVQFTSELISTEDQSDINAQLILDNELRVNSSGLASASESLITNSRNSTRQLNYEGDVPCPGNHNSLNGQSLQVKAQQKQKSHLAESIRQRVEQDRPAFAVIHPIKQQERQQQQELNRHQLETSSTTRTAAAATGDEQHVVRRHRYFKSSCCHEVNLTHVAWYMGSMTQEESQAKLRRCEVGSFLLRDSSQKPKYPFSLSVKTSRGVTSVRIAHKDGLYTLDRPTPTQITSLEKATSLGLQTVQSNCIIHFIETLMNMSKRSHSMANSKSKCILLDKNGHANIDLILTKPVIGHVVDLRVLCCKVINQTRSNHSHNFDKSYYLHTI